MQNRQWIDFCLKILPLWKTGSGLPEAVSVCQQAGDHPCGSCPRPIRPQAPAPLCQLPQQGPVWASGSVYTRPAGAEPSLTTDGHQWLALQPLAPLVVHTETGKEHPLHRCVISTVCLGPFDEILTTRRPRCPPVASWDFVMSAFIFRSRRTFTFTLLCGVTFSTLTSGCPSLR